MKMNPARTYRQFAAQGATSLSLVVQAYDQIANSLCAAIRALEAYNIQKKTEDINHALLLISHLQNALDFKRGGEVARNLERFYAVQRSQILLASGQASPEMLREVVQQFMSMREAWQEVEKSTVSGAKARPTPPPPYGAASSDQPTMMWSA